MQTERKYYPLSHAQQRIYFTEKKYPGTALNSIAYTMWFNEKYDMSVLAEAINVVLKTHEGLRLRIVDLNDGPTQYAADYKRKNFQCLKIQEDDQKQYDRWALVKTNKAFRFIDADLFEFVLIDFNDEQSGCYVKVHHIISDGWSFSILFKEIYEVYQAIISGRKNDSDKQPSYLDYLSAEKEYLASDQYKSDKEFWHALMLNSPERLSILSNITRDPENNLVDNAKVFSYAFGQELSRQIREYCAQKGASIHKFLSVALALYLMRISDTNKIAVGCFNHNRFDERHKETIGMFVSTFPLIVDIDPDMSVSDLIQNMSKKLNTILKEHQKYPFDILAAEMLESTGDNISLNSQGYYKEDHFKLQKHWTNFILHPLLFHHYAKTSAGVIELFCHYQFALFSENNIKQFCSGIRQVAVDILGNPDKRCGDIEILTAENKKEIIEQFNDTATAYPKDKTLQELFCEQADNDRIIQSLRLMF